MHEHLVEAPDGRVCVDINELLKRSARHLAAAPERELLWRVSDLKVRYGRKEVLAALSLGLPKGGVTAIIGPSGCGKSTFLYCLNRLSDSLEGCSVEGQILIGAQDIRCPSIDDIALRKRIGFIFQRPNPFPMSIRRNLELPLRAHGMRDPATIEQKIESCLRAVGLWAEVKDRMNHSALLLSGGQQQRLCIARALVLEPEALLMDEPCSALDPVATGVVEELVRSLRERLTIVMVTHNLNQAKRVGDEVALLWCREGCGYLVESGNVQNVFEAPRDELTKAYITGRIC
ncbi:MAG: phosphate ABC transporter ATP-binding protein [Rhodospirillaceae bacterium]|nr:phosphate ABC transporter ATP-binding protein [Rhodospirillales bacterium]